MKETCRHCGSEIYPVMTWRDAFGELCPSQGQRHLPSPNDSPGAPDVHKLLADALDRIKELEARK